MGEEVDSARMYQVQNGWTRRHYMARSERFRAVYFKPNSGKLMDHQR